MLKMSEELKELYNEVYEEGKETFHTFSLDLIYSEVYKVIKTHLSNRKILDLGCGDGDFLKRFVTLENPKEIHGYDFSEVGIGKCKIINETTPDVIKNIYRNISLEDLKFEIVNDVCEELYYFDIITSIGVIEHLDNPEILFYLVDKLLTKD